MVEMVPLHLNVVLHGMVTRPFVLTSFSAEFYNVIKS